jgi:hypothetical protein
VEAAKWSNPAFAEGVILDFADVQSRNLDGRIDEWAHSAIRGQPGDVSDLPVFFESAYDVARRTEDVGVRQTIYEAMASYLNWWLSPVKRDAATGLISAVFEESYDCALAVPQTLAFVAPQTLAPVDLNVAVAVGAALTADLAHGLGKPADASSYRKAFESLAEAINDYQWDEASGAYHCYNLRTGERVHRLSAATFDPLRIAIAPAERRERLLRRLVDPSQFNWGRFPLTGLARSDPAYDEESGNVWTRKNWPVIKGLAESGREDLSAELNWATIKAFSNNYREFIRSSTGEGQGARDYTQTASHYIQMVVDHLFGIDFDQIQHLLQIEPHIPRALYGKTLSIQNLILPTGAKTRLAVRIHQTSSRDAVISIEIAGELPEGKLRVGVPGRRVAEVEVRRHVTVRVGNTVSVL